MLHLRRIPARELRLGMGMLQILGYLAIERTMFQPLPDCGIGIRTPSDCHFLRSPPGPHRRIVADELAYKVISGKGANEQPMYTRMEF